MCIVIVRYILKIVEYMCILGLAFMQNWSNLGLVFVQNNSNLGLVFV